MPKALTLIGVLVLLAGVGSLATLALKEAAIRRDPRVLALGILGMVALGLIVMLASRIAELTLVSLGWIVIFQVVVTFVDVRWYGVRLGPVQAVAIGVALTALVVAIVATPAPLDAAG
jgi:hypothetical protein